MERCSAFKNIHVKEKDKNGKHVAKKSSGNDIVRMMAIIRNSRICNEKSHSINNELDERSKYFHTPEMHITDINAL